MIITAQQAALGPRFYKKWEDAAFCCQGLPITTSVETAIAVIYSALGRVVPSVQWASSPLEGLLLAVKAQDRGAVIQKNACVEKPTTEAWEDFRTQLSANTAKVLAAKLDQKLRDGVAGEVVDAVMADLKARIAAVTIKGAPAIMNQLADNAFFGSMSGYYLACIDFCQGALGLITNQRAEKIVRGLVNVARGGWVWFFDSTVVATRLPVRISRDADGHPHRADGPAIEYEGGYGVYCWRGTNVPKDALERGGVSWGQVRQCTNTDLQQAVKEVKIDAWSKEAPAQDASLGETAEERREAADAFARLGGLEALEGLTEGDK